MGTPVVTVLIVSDYGAGGSRSWEAERSCLRALAAQDTDASVQYLLCEETVFEGQVPADLYDILPELSIAFFPVSGSYALKNAGARSCNSPYVALLDADCRPSPNWIRSALDVLQSRTDIAAVSGRTIYEETGLMERVLCLLSRSFLDPGRTGPTRFLANNGALIRRDVYLRNPLPEHLGAFAGRIQSEAILRDGFQLWFDESVTVTHEFEGWHMEADIRRNIGFGTVATRMEDPRLPYTWLTDLGPLAIPVIVAGKTFDSFLDCLRCASFYGVRWFEVPAALAMAVIVHFMEVPGMLSAYAGKPVQETAYR